MGDTVKDNASITSFLLFASAFIFVVVGVVILAGYKAPNVWSAITVEGRRCDTSASKNDEWYRLQGHNECVSLTPPTFNDTNKEHFHYFLHELNTAFSFEVPQSEGPESVSVGLSRYQRRLIGVMRLHLFKTEDQLKKIQFESSLGYTDQDSPGIIHKIAKRIQKKKTLCHMMTKNYFQGHSYDCAPAVLFTLYSLHHDRYILNIKPDRSLPQYYRNLAHIRKLFVSFVSDNGDYIKFLWSLKAIFFVVVLVSLSTFLRIHLAVERDFSDMDKALTSVSFILLFMTCPWDFLMVAKDIPGFIIFNDIRDSLFYFSFLNLFVSVTGDCLGQSRVQIAGNYSALLTFLTVAIVDSVFHYFCVSTPLTGKWNGMHFGFAMTYFFLLALYFVPITIRTFSGLLAVQDWDPVSREERNSNGRWRHRWRQLLVLVVSWICVVLTLTEFIIKRLHDGMCFWDDTLGNLEIMNTGPLLLGVFCLWNMYICWMHLLYLPCYVPQDLSAIPMEQWRSVPG